MRIASLLLAAGLMPLWAQDIKLPANLDKLSAKAEESVDVTLDGSLLKMAARFLSDKDDPDIAKVKRIIAKLEGVYVRSYQFAEEGEYSRADVESVRSQLHSPAWGRIVGVRSRREGGDVDVFLKLPGNGTLGGAVIIVAEPRELTFVNVVGTIEPDDVANLSGQFHIPRLHGSVPVPQPGGQMSSRFLAVFLVASGVVLMAESEFDHVVKAIEVHYHTKRHAHSVPWPGQRVRESGASGRNQRVQAGGI